MPVDLKRLLGGLVISAVLAGAARADEAAGAASKAGAEAAKLDQALAEIVAKPDGPPGAIAVIDRNGKIDVHTAGVADLATKAPPSADDHMRIASVSKAFGAAAIFAAVADGALSLDDTVGRWLPDLPRSWSNVTLRQLLAHTSGIDDFSELVSMQNAVAASPGKAPPPRELLTFLGDTPPAFPPGSRYRYSNTENIIAGLMLEAATHQPYEGLLATKVYDPLGLTGTSIPPTQEMPAPILHGYFFDPPRPLKDVTFLMAGTWPWASGGLVSTPDDMTRFIRAYVTGKTTNKATHDAQFTFVDGRLSDPPGPGDNAGGLAIFRYTTRCGTAYGHSGSIQGHTQFLVASEDGQRSAAVTLTAEILPRNYPLRFPDVRNIFELAVCAAME